MSVRATCLVTACLLGTGGELSARQGVDLAERLRALMRTEQPAFLFACDGPAEEAKRLAHLRFDALAAPNLELDREAAGALAGAGVKLIPDLDLAGSPSPQSPAKRAAVATSVARQGKRLDQVKAWLVGLGLDHRHEAQAAAAAAGFAVADPGRARPVLVGATEALEHFARHANGLIVPCPVLGTRWGDPAGAVDRLQDLIARLRPTQTSLVVQLETDWPRHRHGEAAGSGALDVVGPDAEQVRLQAFLSLVAGAKGLLVPTQALLGRQPALDDVVAELGLVGCHLRLVADTLASGRRAAAPKLDTKAVLAVHIEHKRDHLVLLVRVGRGYQYVVDEALADDFYCTVGPTSRQAKAYWVDFPTVKPLKSLRVGRDLKISVPRLDLTGMIFVTDELDRVKALGKRVSAHRAAAVEFAVRALRGKYDRVASVVNRLKKLGVALPLADELIEQARRKARSVGQNPPPSQHAQIYQSARDGVRLLRMAEWYYWRRAQGRYRPGTFPYTDHFYALLAHYRMLEAFDVAGPHGSPLLQDGFEADAVGPQWRRPPGVAVAQSVTVRTTDRKAHAGRSSATVRSWTVARRFGTPVDEPIPGGGLVSQPVAVQHGDLLRLSVWVNVPTAFSETLRGALAGLVFYDGKGRPIASSGERSAAQLDPTEEFTELLLYSYVDDKRVRSCAVTLSVAGVGAAHFDDVRLTRVPRRATASTKPK